VWTSHARDPSHNYYCRDIQEEYEHGTQRQIVYAYDFVRVECVVILGSVDNCATHLYLL
jgi:hypothetical protein